MPQYAYIPYKDEYLTILSCVEVDEYKQKKVLKIDAMTLSDTEKDFIKDQIKETFYCLVCDHPMFRVKPTKKNNYFRHKTTKFCMEAESLAHASAKRELYEKFKQAGFEVQTEREFNFVGYTLKADVAVREQKDRLVIEVQASNSIQMATIAKRTNAYASGSIPTAWVILLDSFFGPGKYAGTSITDVIKHNDGTYENRTRPLSYGEEAVFTVIGEERSNFNLLMESYKYIVAIDHDGFFYLIRTNPNDELFSISRIQHEQIVSVLLETPLLTIDYDTRKNGENEKSPFFKGSDCGEDQLALDLDIELVGMNFLSQEQIDFFEAQIQEQNCLMEEKHFLNPLDLIRETQLHFKLKVKWENKVQQSLLRLNEEIKKHQLELFRIDEIQAELIHRLRHLEMAAMEYDRVQEELKFSHKWTPKLNKWQGDNSREKKVFEQTIKELRAAIIELQRKCKNFEVELYKSQTIEAHLSSPEGKTYSERPRSELERSLEEKLQKLAIKQSKESPVSEGRKFHSTSTMYSNQNNLKQNQSHHDNKHPNNSLKLDSYIEQVEEKEFIKDLILQIYKDSSLKENERKALKRRIQKHMRDNNYLTVPLRNMQVMFEEVNELFKSIKHLDKTKQEIEYQKMFNKKGNDFEQFRLF